MNFSVYFQACKNYFWQWEEEGQVLSVTDGITIGYRHQVAEMLLQVAEKGLPPFGSFLLAMIATNRTDDDTIIHVAEKISEHSAKINESFNFLEDAFEFLRLLKAIPDEYKSGERRQILLRTIFENAHNRVNIATSKGLASTLKETINSKFRPVREIAFDRHILVKDFRCIGLLLKTFPTAQSVIDAMGDLPEIKEPILLPETTGGEEKIYSDFIEELLHNNHSFQVAALIKPIWAGFRVPIFTSHPSEQPLGGLSDISNKGNFDKLLVSEFANDELVFMNRIANNEALYLYREMPPVRDDLHRTILIDISLKTWGTPKLVAFAAYIAIAKHPKSVHTSDAYVAGDVYSKVSCGNIHEVIDGIQRTDAALHPAKGLADFLEDNRADRQMELFFITSAASLKEPSIQKLVAENHAVIRYIITTDATGQIVFYRNKNRALQHLQTLELPLGKLWSNKPQPKAEEVKRIETREQNRKAIVPVLLPQPAVSKKTVVLDDHVYWVTHGKLLRQLSTIEERRQPRGWELLLEGVPNNGIYEAGRLVNGEILFLAYDLQTKKLNITNLSNGKSASTIFNQWRGKLYREFLFREEGHFLHLYRNPDAIELAPDFLSGKIGVKKVSSNSGVFTKDYQHRQEERNTHEIQGNHNILKKLRSVSINKDNELLFNNHKLVVTNDDRFMLVNYHSHTLTYVQAKMTNNGRHFLFNNGSAVLLDPAGYITLVSHEQLVPDIYIPSALDTEIAVATEYMFAGKTYYYNDHLSHVTVTLKSAGESILQTMQAIRSFLPINLNELKKMVENCPSVLSKTMPFEDAKELVKALNKAGATAEHGIPGNASQQIVSAKRFYEENIEKFIRQIIQV